MRSPMPIPDRLLNRVARAMPRRMVNIAPERPIVSFSFDDVPVSACTNGARILEEHGVRGTFYASGGLSGRTHDGEAILGAEGYRQLAERGHEIGHHTFSHRRPIELMIGFAGDLDRNDLFIEEVSGKRARNFAYPYGLSSPHIQSELVRRFRSSRSIHAGVNRGPTDLDYLDAIDIRSNSGEDELHAWIDDVAATPGWLIYFTHDVCEAPGNFGCRPEILAGLVRAAQDRGCEVLTVDTALDRLEVS